MNECIARATLPGYVSIKEAARILGISDKRVYEYVDQGRLGSAWAANVIVIPLDEVKAFKRQSAGRPRKTIPPWRISTGNNGQFITSIVVQVRQGQRSALLERLETMRKHSLHCFPGTVARFISEQAGQICVTLVWKGEIAPEEAEQEKALEAFRQDLDSMLDWSTAHYTTSRVLMHT